MSHQSAARVLRRACQRRGHLPKTDGQGKRMCARCLIALDPPPLSVAGEVQPNG